MISGVTFYTAPAAADWANCRTRREFGGIRGARNWRASRKVGVGIAVKPHDCSNTARQSDELHGPRPARGSDSASVHVGREHQPRIKVGRPVRADSPGDTTIDPPITPRRFGLG